MTLPKDAYAVGRTLAELNLLQDHIVVTAVRRHGIRGADPLPEMKVQADDALIMHGSPEALQIAERFILTGKR